MFASAYDSMSGHLKEREARFISAAEESMAVGQYDEAADLFAKVEEKRYRRDTTLAVKYAEALRKNGNSKKAASMLERFFRFGMEEVDPAVLNEYAANEIILGNFEEAQAPLDIVLKNENAKDYHAMALYLSGQILANAGDHPAALKMYNEAVQGWKGDTSPVLISMAMSYAQQGSFDKAMAKLNKALLSARDKNEVGRAISQVDNMRTACQANKKAGSFCSRKKA